MFARTHEVQMASDVTIILCESNFTGEFLRLQLEYCVQACSLYFQKVMYCLEVHRSAESVVKGQRQKTN